MPEPASPMFLINPSTTNAGEHSGEECENIFSIVHTLIYHCKMIIRFKFQMADCEDDEGSPEDQAAIIRKLGTFCQKKAMTFKPPRFYGHQLNCLKLWRSMIRLGGYDRILLQYERHRTQNRELQLPIAPPSSFSGVDNENEVEHPMKAAETETSKQLDVQVVDIRPLVDWVKINVPETISSSLK
ncbi:hypothetical protein H5410_061685 [Solanum commersonii]|uniref:ARID domain-containing protein n=1 Tax=Solanum commersonii TaxID=4109 RepID=A0A9J5W9C1_SOLCO|nr:hypothetical protein H5410_061685 [Solanum commersonii]